VFKSNRQLQRFLSGSRPIHNRSFRTLNDVEIEALALGLGFIPVKNHPPEVSDLMTKETNRLIKAIDTTIHFALQPQHHQLQCDDDTCHNDGPSMVTTNHPPGGGLAKPKKFKKRYGSLAKIVPNPWQPPKHEWIMEPEINHALGRLAAGCGVLPARQQTATPLEILQAFDNLLNDPDILICAADKGGTIVIWRTAEYEREALAQLSDESTYAPVSTETFNALRDDRLVIERNRLARRLLNLKCLNAHEYRAVVAAPAEPAAFYMKPKLHKAINRETATFHGRPIASTCKSAPRLLDKYLANVTSPLLPLIPGSLTDTTHLLQKLSLYSSSVVIPVSESSNSRLVTADVNSLYPSIPWEQGVDAALQFYTEHYARLRSEMRDRGLLPPPPPELFGEILWFIVTNSFVSFKRFFPNSQSTTTPNQPNILIFHQTKGTAMGCCVSVFLANCFMFKVTRHLIERPPGHHLDFFFRYIDDLLFSTKGTDQDIADLISSITTEAITYTVGDKLGDRVEFLDVAIEIDSETKRIKTSPFQKATASPFYLHAESMHPKHTIDSLPYAQLIRLKRICSSEQTYLDAAGKLLDKFRARGYKMHVLNRAFFRALAIPREQLLQRNKKTIKKDTPGHTICPTQSIESGGGSNNRAVNKKQTLFNNDTLKFIPMFDKSHNWRQTRKTLEKIKRLTTRYYHGTGAADALAAKQTALIFKRARNVGASFLNKTKNLY
jgi:hypothetical protein